MKMKQPKRGSVLAMTIALTTVFTIFGLSSLYFGTLYNDATERNIISRQAFWLAEAGVQRATTYPSVGITSYPPLIEGPATLGEGRSYETHILPYCYDDPNNHSCTEPSDYRWWIESRGVVNSVTERIKVEYGLTIFKAFNSESEKGFSDNTDPDDYIKDKSYALNLNLDEGYFAELFGFSEPITAPPTPPPLVNTYINPNNDNEIIPVTGITLIMLDDDAELNITNLAGKGFLIVEGGTLRIAGGVSEGVFEGIIWVRGNLEFLTGSREVYGSIFVSCGEDGETMIGGEGYNETKGYPINFDQKAIDDVFAMLVGGGGGQWNYAVVSWEQALPPFSWE